MSQVLGVLWLSVIALWAWARRPPRRRPVAFYPAPKTNAVAPLCALGRVLRRPLRRWVEPTWSDRSLGAAGLGAFLAVVIGRFVGCVVVVGFLIVLAARNRRRRLARADSVLRGLGELALLLQLTTESGFSLRSGLALVVPWVPGPVGDAFAQALRRADAGNVLADEVDRCRSEFGPAARPLIAALLSAERHGAPLAAPLAVAGSELRALRRRSTEEAARRIPVRLLPPLVLGVLPAFCLLTVVPLLAGSLDLLRNGRA